MHLGRILEQNARLDPHRTALVFEGRRFTHAQHLARARRLANGLAARGLLAQERVAIISRNSAEYMELFGACMVAGFVIVNLNHRLAVPELLPIARDCEPAALVFSNEFIAEARAIREATPSIRFAIGIECAEPGADEYEAVLAASNDSRPAPPSPTDLFCLIYTSGSTGRPKGVMYNHHGMLTAARVQSHETNALSTDVFLVVMPLFHVGALIEHLTFAWLGATTVLHRAFEPATILESMEQEKVTSAHLAPVMIQRLLDAPEFARHDGSRLRNIQYASAPMPLPILRRALAAWGPVLVQIYGMTECLSGTALKPHQHKLDGDPVSLRRLGSAGQPFRETELRVVRDDGTDCASGEIGEVLLRGEGTMVGYWNNQAATIEALRDGWYHTLDLGTLDEEGFLTILDRKRDMIISGGENIYSWEVEEALRHHQAVHECAVIAVPDAQWGESVKACVVLREGASATEAALIEHCRTLIASYKKPRSIDFLPELPRLFNGKVDKKALRAPHWAARARQVS